MTDKITVEFTTEEYAEIKQLQESIRLAKKAAEEAHKKGMSREEADRHIFDKVSTHEYSKPERGAGGMVNRFKADHHTDIGIKHFDTLRAKEKESKVKKESVVSPVDLYTKVISEQARKDRGDI